MNAQNTAAKEDILIIDDTPENLRLLSSALTERGYRVRSVISGARALMGAQAAPPDLIMLDIRMPDMDGYEVCQHLKANERTCAVPVIFINALDEVLDKVKAFTSGGVDYIQKPFQIEEVVARLENQQLQQTQAEPGFLTSKRKTGSINCENVITTKRSAVYIHDPDRNRV
jgi:two-component system, sensor histidine kinase and response regulator